MRTTFTAVNFVGNVALNNAQSITRKFSLGAIGAITIVLAACGGGGGNNAPQPAAAGASSTAPAQPASAPASNVAVTAPGVTNTLTQGVGLVWQQGTVDFNATVPGLGTESVSLPVPSTTPQYVSTGTATYIQAKFAGAYDTPTRNTLMGTLAYLTSTDGITWQAGASALPNVFGSGFIPYPVSMASDGKGTIAVLGLAVPPSVSWVSGLSAEPLLSAPVTAFVAFANSATMKWTVTPLPVTSAAKGDEISYAYGRWWVSYTPSMTPGVKDSVLESANGTQWSASSAPDVNFLPQFTQSHPYWSSTPAESDDLQTWTAQPPMSPDGSLRYLGAVIANSKAMVITDAQSIFVSTNQDDGTGTLLASIDGKNWAAGAFDIPTGVSTAFVCADRFFAYQAAPLGGGSVMPLFLSDDGMNWTHTTMSPVAGSILTNYVQGGCMPGLNRVESDNYLVRWLDDCSGR